MARQLLSALGAALATSVLLGLTATATLAAGGGEGTTDRHLVEPASAEWTLVLALLALLAIGALAAMESTNRRPRPWRHA